MKVLSILTALLVSGALAAQGRPADDMNGRVILFGEVAQTSGILLGQDVKDQANRQTAPGLRIMGQFDDNSPWYWELGGRFRSGSDMITNRDISTPPGPANVANVTGVKVHYSYYAGGIGYQIPLGSMVDLGLHVEARAETINPKGVYSTTLGGTASIDAHNVYFRPWARLSLGVRARTGGCYTLFGAEASVAATNNTQHIVVSMSQMDKQTMRAMAPTWSSAIYGGIQF